MASLRFWRLGPLSLFVAACAALTACSGGGLGLGGLTQQVCNTGTQTQLASPLSGQTGVSPTTGQIIIVANGNNNQLYSTYSQWSLTLVDNAGGVINGGRLQLVPFPSGPHPYPSDFYYGSSVSLSAARTYSVSLGLPGGSCRSIPLGSFST